MADETPVTPGQGIVPEAVSIRKLRLSSKIYPQESVDVLVNKVATDSETRASELDQKITNTKSELSASISNATTELNTTIANTKAELEQKISASGGGGTGTEYKGVVEHEAELATIAQSGTLRHGDWYIARDTGKSWVWTVSENVGDWVQMSSTVDLSNYPTRDEVYLKAYIDALVNRLVAAETKLTKITTALSELLTTDALVYEEYTADDLFRRTNTLLRVLKAAVASEETAPEP